MVGVTERMSYCPLGLLAEPLIVLMGWLAELPVVAGPDIEDFTRMLCSVHGAVADGSDWGRSWCSGEPGEAIRARPVAPVSSACRRLC